MQWNKNSFKTEKKVETNSTLCNEKEVPPALTVTSLGISWEKILNHSVTTTKTTANMIYHLQDYPSLFSSRIWIGLIYKHEFKFEVYNQKQKMGSKPFTSSLHDSRQKLLLLGGHLQSGGCSFFLIRSHQSKEYWRIFIMIISPPDGEIMSPK